jgi:hypothetical protein
VTKVLSASAAMALAALWRGVCMKLKRSSNISAAAVGAAAAAAAGVPASAPLRVQLVSAYPPSPQMRQIWQQQEQRSQPRAQSLSRCSTPQQAIRCIL